jgi:hypothetical protein
MDTRLNNLSLMEHFTRATSPQEKNEVTIEILKLSRNSNVSVQFLFNIYMGLR